MKPWKLLYKDLHRVEIELFTAMVNVGFKGCYADISRLHEVDR